jgi:hypothetical protein
MEPLHQLPESTLVDLLAKYTARYTQLFANRDFESEEFEKCKLMVKCLQQEIEIRKNPRADMVSGK